jgi:hypothetical protein
MADVEGGFEVIYDDQSETTSTGGPWQPGQIVVHRSGTGRAQRALAKWMLIDNAGISQGEVAVSDFAATNSNTVAKASTTDGAAPHFRGIAAATIASNKYGFFFINGYGRFRRTHDDERFDCRETDRQQGVQLLGGNPRAVVHARHRAVRVRHRSWRVCYGRRLRSDPGDLGLNGVFGVGGLEIGRSPHLRRIHAPCP